MKNIILILLFLSLASYAKADNAKCGFIVNDDLLEVHSIPVGQSSVIILDRNFTVSFKGEASGISQWLQQNSISGWALIFNLQSWSDIHEIGIAQVEEKSYGSEIKEVGMSVAQALQLPLLVGMRLNPKNTLQVICHPGRAQP